MSNPLSRFVNAASLNKLKGVIVMNLRNLTQFHQKVSTLLGVGCQVRCHGFTFFPGSVKLFDSVVLRCNKNLNSGVNLRCLFGSLSFGCKVIQLEHLYTEWSIHFPLRGRINRAISFSSRWSAVRREGLVCLLETFCVFCLQEMAAWIFHFILFY